MPDAEKRKRADHVLATDQTLAETAADLDRLLEEIRLKNKGKF
jgi:dephospho-CoA kinase